MTVMLSKKQIEIIERRAIRKHKQEVRSNILCCLMTVGFMATMVGGVVYSFIV